MRLKHGKKYETADGVVLKVFEKHHANIDWVAFESFGDMSALYDVNGVARGLGSEFNLIRRHYKNPQPAHKLDLKPGDVVELVAWEDGSDVLVGKRITIGIEGLPDTIGPYGLNDYPKGQRPLFRVVSRASYPMPPS